MATEDIVVRILEEGVEETTSKVRKLSDILNELGVSYVKAIAPKQLYRGFKDISKIMGDLEKKTRRFKMEWLSVLFFSMSIQRTLSKIGTSAIAEFKRATEATTFWTSNIGRLQLGLTMIRITMGEMINQALRPFADWLISNLPTILDFISKNGEWLAIIGLLVTALTSLGIAISVVKLGIDGLLVILNPIITGIGALIGTVGGSGLLMLIGIFGSLFYILKQIVEYGFLGFIDNVIQGVKNVILVISEWVKWLKDDLLVMLSKVQWTLGTVIDFARSLAAILSSGLGGGLVSSVVRLGVKLANRMLGSKQFGGVIPATGLYKMHAGEMVYNPQFGGANITMNNTVSSNVDVNHLANRVSDIIMKDIKRYVNPVSQYG